MGAPELKSLPKPSSNIAATAHEGTNLYVRFHSSPQVWKFEGVSKATYDEMLAQESVGSYFQRHVRGKYPGGKLGEEPADQ